jgi:hypothetical protein
MHEGTRTVARKLTRQRTDAVGRAFAGSQRLVQEYVSARRDVLDQAVLKALPSEYAAATIEWRAPLEVYNYAEPLDAAFLEALRLESHVTQLADFWPKSGPRWDALAILRGEGGSLGYLLVEGKSYPGEVRGRGCSAKAERSLNLINAAINATKNAYGVPATADWLGELYQYANRLAHVHFLRTVTRRPAWLVNLCFTGDPRSPTSPDEWCRDFEIVKNQLELPPAARSLVVDVLLPA